jgi:hypothetical protein
MVRQIALLLALALLAVLTGCGDGGAQVAGALLDGRSAAHDTDSDGITDGREQALGTDPLKIDSDGDGLSDQYELWGVTGIPLGADGPTSGLPDANANGVHAALDRAEVGPQLLSARGVSALDDTRVRVSAPGDDPLENDLDGDYIPSDFELSGFYYEIDPISGEDWFVKWDGEPNRNYYKTDPTKWSTDADPWSDWEEATKRNLDQRLKHPGDHPCIPAYPEIQAVLVSYSVEDASKIESTSGKTTQSGWTNSVESKDKTETDWNLNVTGSLEYEHKTEVNVLGGIDHNNTLTFGVKVSGHYGSAHSTESTTSNDTSGLSRQEWESAIAGDTINTAKLILNLKLLNIGTLPANNAKVLFNLKLGDFIIDSFLVPLTAENGYGELEALGQNTVDYVVSNNGKGTVYVAPKDLFLSLPQLRTLHMGAPLTVELVSFEAQTLVGEFDSTTGRRVNLNIGPWSAYQSALENSTARLLLDLGDDLDLPPTLPGEIPARRTQEARVFAYDNTGSYIGSPPVVTLRDALRWAFDSRETTFGPTVTITDPVNRQKRTEFLADYVFGLDAGSLKLVKDNPQYREDLFSLPLYPSNPAERVYVAQAPPLVVPGESIDESRPRVYSAAMFPYEQERRSIMRPIPPPAPTDPAYKDYDPDNPPLQFDRYVYVPVYKPTVRAFAVDREGVNEVRFLPRPGAFGEKMTYVDDPQHPERGGFWEYEVPAHYIWTGFESVVAYNFDNLSSPPFNIVLQPGGYLDQAGELVTGGNRDPFAFGTHTSFVRDQTTGDEIPSTQFLDDLANDFVAQGVRAGDIVLNPTLSSQALVVSVATHRLELNWSINNPQVPADQVFKYGQRYVVLTGTRRYDELGFEQQTGTRPLQAFETAPTDRSIGMNFTNTARINVAPFDIRVEEIASGGLPLTRTLKLGAGVGMAVLGKASLHDWSYSAVRKATLGTADIDISNQPEDMVYVVRLLDGRSAKFQLQFVDEMVNSVSTRRVSSVDWVIYAGN